MLKSIAESQQVLGSCRSMKLQSDGEHLLFLTFFRAPGLGGSRGSKSYSPSLLMLLGIHSWLETSESENTNNVPHPPESDSNRP